MGIRSSLNCPGTMCFATIGEFGLSVAGFDKNGFATLGWETTGLGINGFVAVTGFSPRVSWCMSCKDPAAEVFEVLGGIA